jgi:alpha-tubulin suppressor-like RCC1 family protein
MANIKKLQLNGKDIIPITHESAVIDDNGISIADKYQTKEDQNLDTNSKTIIGAINELNVNNVHLGNALGAVEYDDNDNPIIERLDDLESSLIRLIGNFSNNGSDDNESSDNETDPREVLYNMMIEDGYNEATSEMTVDELIQLLDDSQIDINDIKQISCGCIHTVILKNDGTVWVTGDNEYGQLGLNDTTDRYTFTQVTTNISDVKQIICGGYHTFMLKNDGTVWACGYNNKGQLGLNDTTNRTSFTQVTTNISDVKEIICGRYHTFMLKNDSSMYSCGDNANGQLGLGDTTQRTTFTQAATNTSNIKQIVCGGNHTFIIKNDGSVYACGDNAEGQLGLNNTTDRKSFTKVTTNISDVKQIVCGDSHTFMLKNDGSVWSCGDSAYGQLGLGDTTDKTTFTKVSINISNDVEQIVCGYQHTIILKKDGTVWACGFNQYGQLGLNDTNHRTTFKQVTTNISDIKQIAGGYAFTFILKNDDTVWASGYNGYGQLGLGDTIDKTTFTQVPLSQLIDEYEMNRLKLYYYLLDNSIPVLEDMDINTMLDLLIIVKDSNAGKQLIATAIGEPLNANDTFAAMSDDINGLLSTFKANMMNNGVAVESGDKFKALIDKIATMRSGGGLDIISATELPATGKENQICVITDNPVNSFIVTPNSNDASSDLDNIICYIGNSSSMDTNLGTLCTIQNNNITIKYYFNEICQGPNRLDSYIYQSSQWSTLTVRSIFFIKNNYYVNESVSGTISTGSSVSINNTSGITLKTLYSSSSAGRSFPGTAFSNRINFSSLNKMVIKTYSSRSSVKLHFYACNKNSYMTYTTVSSVVSSLDVKHTSTISNVTTSTTPQEYTIDISSWQGDYYLGICAEATSNIGETCYVYISHIELI